VAGTLHWAGAVVFGFLCLGLCASSLISLRLRARCTRSVFVIEGLSEQSLIILGRSRAFTYKRFGIPALHGGQGANPAAPPDLAGKLPVLFSAMVDARPPGGKTSRFGRARELVST
jgi:hypothetical protein